METICSGWLIKSPPGKFVNLPFPLTQKIIKAKWRKRYFVLYKPDRSLPGEYALEYYDDESLRRRRGSICLEECEQIISSLESSYYQHLFSLCTKQKSRPRTYYLAADNEADMAKWVHCLCNVCGLNNGPPTSISRPPDLTIDNDVDIVGSDSLSIPPPPPLRVDSMALTPTSDLEQELGNASLMSASQRGGATQLSSSHDSESYIPLDECSTGMNNMSVEEKATSAIRESFSSITSSTSYDILPCRQSAARESLQGDIYDTPPTREDVKQKKDRSSAGADSLYQVPPLRSPGGLRSSEVPYDSSARAPEHWRASSEGASQRVSECIDYDIPPLVPAPACQERPARPPKPSTVAMKLLGSPQGLQVDGVHEREISAVARNSEGLLDSDSIYDLPRTVTTTVDSRLLPASPPLTCDGGDGDIAVHKYINAALGLVHSTLPPADMPSAGDCSAKASEDDDLYNVPPEPVAISEGQRSGASAAAESTYSHPRALVYPVQPQQRRCASLNPARTDPLPARPFKPKQLRDTHTGPSLTEGTYASPPVRIPMAYNKQMSFPPSSIENDRIPLPTKTCTSATGSDSSNDDDDDSGSSSDNNSDALGDEGDVIYQFPRQVAPSTALGNRPSSAQPTLTLSPAADKVNSGNGRAPAQQQQIEYLDLDHDTDAESHSPLPSRSASFGNQAAMAAACGSSATEYTDIDKVKTKALESTKREMESRKISEKE